MGPDLDRLFGHLFFGGFDDFFGTGTLAPESVPRRILGLAPGAPLEVMRVHQAFRQRIKALRPDLTERQADDLRLRDAAAQPQEEALTELLWAREDLLRRAGAAEADRKAREAATGRVAATSYRSRATVGSRNEPETAAQQIERLTAAGGRRAKELTSADYRAPDGRWRGYRTEYVRLDPRKPFGERERWVTFTESPGAGLSDTRNSPAPVCWRCRTALAPGATAYLKGGHREAAPRCEACYRADEWKFAPKARGPCAVCGRPVVRGSWWPPTVTCSPECKALLGTVRQRERRLEGRQGKTCGVCGETFEATRADQVTCSAACRQRAYRQRRSDRRVYRNGEGEAAG